MDLYHYLECGLDYIYLVNTWTGPEVDSNREKAIDADTRLILEADALHHEIAKAIILSPRSLRGHDLLFLRTQLDLNASEYCEMVGVQRLKLLEWEGSSEAVPKYADTCARLIYAAGCSDGELGQRVVRMLRNERPTEGTTMPHMIAFERSSGAWRVAERWPLTDSAAEPSEP